ncbi:MAG: DUF1674 domain-containing protein [Rhodospirillaceae bacterium]|nr:DUF1674 domain-containing protein [Rhodospirillaceae bacterium]MBT5240551.1 DUF1674 domain-containing protein [Rhodospirillaceae bacterium]MBT5564885.1 DUF1674 domain-containing protein [Rhodospirillaceae bacterium]MBT6090575.1 DUF1674 domain-containing protein [Rhodospirillaceae bacterium]MBT6961656.1 DUF1674 domain-containing protein [Rhodospirillaceae bacterium]
MSQDTRSPPRSEKKESEKPATPIKPGKTSDTDADEVGGPKGPEPTRFGDWERKGRCSDF